MICRMTEVQFYDNGDRHQIAYTRLQDERSRNMIKLLGLEDKDATTVDACLRCHALPEVGAERTSKAFLSEGVTCVACHGAFQEWVDQHPSAVTLRELRKQRARPRNDARKDWLDLTRNEKEELKGMIDLWDPVRRTEVCASCHFGNYKEKKVITHAMYAAGHPPLPGFEPATFSELEPRHWQYIREKDKDRRDRLRPFDESNLEHAELVAISGPIMLRESMRLFADRARARGDNRFGSGWPDFARYDCRACHHELKSAANDHSRTEPFAPGRPSEPRWVHALTRIGISGLTATPEDAATETSRYDSLLKALHEAMSAEPFGSGSRSIQAADDLAAWADNLVKTRPRHVPVDKKRAWTMLAQLCDEGATRSLDYDSARQFAWAFSAIYHDVIWDEEQQERHKDIEGILNQLDAALFMKLNSVKDQVPIEDSLKTRLAIAAEYNPATTAKLFAQLKALVAHRGEWAS
jgi:Cytochrome c554 and c-prime